MGRDEAGVGRSRLAGALGLGSRRLLGLLAGGLLSRRDDGHGAGLRRDVEVAAEIDGDVADVHAEQVVNLVLEHERRDEAVGDAGDGDLRRDAFDGEDLEHAVFHECILHVDAGFGIDGEQLHEAVAFSLHALGQGGQALDRDLLVLCGYSHGAYASFPFFIAARFSSRMPTASTTASMMASGRTAQPGAYTSTGMAWSTPPMTL